MSIALKTPLTCSLKILQFADRRSLLSIPCFLGIEPKRNAASAFVNATERSVVGTTPKNKPNDQINGSTFLVILKFTARRH